MACLKKILKNIVTQLSLQKVISKYHMSPKFYHESPARSETSCHIYILQIRHNGNITNLMFLMNFNFIDLHILFFSSIKFMISSIV